MPVEIAPGLSAETVGDLIGGSHEDEVAKPMQPPALPFAPKFPEPGIYFGMPEDTYHAIHACSASGLKKLSVSSMDYWAESVLNQEAEDEEDEPRRDKFDARALGRAYHARICEGQEEYLKRYAPKLDKKAVAMEAEAKGKRLCVTVKDIREAIDEAEGKPKGTAKDGLIEQLLDLDPDAWVWDRIEAKYMEENGGKTLIPMKFYRRIEIAWAMIMGDPNLRGAFTGGHPEVSIFWHDERTGVPCKARFDYLKMGHLVDLKSFGNPMGKPVQRAIDMAIANQKYFIPVVFYLEAIAAAKKMVKATGGRRGGKEPGINDVVQKWNEIDSDEARALQKWCWAWAHQPEPEVLFVFQQTGKAPVTRGRIMSKGTTFTVNEQAVQMLKKKWRYCATAFGTDPWIDIEPVVATVDEELGWAATDFGEIHVPEEG